jgi:hypothetical protein
MHVYESQRKRGVPLTLGYTYKVINRIVTLTGGKHLDAVELPCHADLTRYEVKPSLTVWEMTGKLSAVWTVLNRHLGLRQDTYILI